MRSSIQPRSEPRSVDAVSVARSRARSSSAAVVAAAILSAIAWIADARAELSGRVHEAGGEGVVGAMVTFMRGDPAHRVTVFTDESGRFQAPLAPSSEPTVLRVRRIGWKDLRETDRVFTGSEPLDIEIERETDPAAVAAQLPANRWLNLVLERIDDPDQLEEFKRQCTYCHQQGSRYTRLVRDEAEWRKVLALMGRMGGMISSDLRESLPTIFNAAYDPNHAVAELTTGLGQPDFAPPPPPEVRRAVIDEWELGGRASVQHDLLVHPDGRVYSVDMSQDRLYRLDPSKPGGDRRSWRLPDAGLPLGGVFASRETPDLPNTNAHVGPHSLQVAPDGAVWITLALGNRLARFDPQSESFELVELENGYYPHTLRFDPRGRIWYTIAASNHLGMYDPATGEHRDMRLPAGNLTQAAVLRMMPFLLWLGRHVDLRSAAGEGDGLNMPVPYGVDVAPGGDVWFSQLNEHRIGRVDPDTFELEMIDTPFPAPRRLRFDSRGRLWIPSFSGSLLASFDPKTREFREWPIPIEPLGSETPYALHVDRRRDIVWICGTASDTLIRFDPATERFTVYPMPFRVTYTREIDFDAEGRVWTSNSNGPTWQIEGGVPQVIRLDPNGAEGDAVAVAAPAR